MEVFFLPLQIVFCNAKDNKNNSNILIMGSPQSAWFLLGSPKHLIPNKRIEFGSYPSLGSHSTGCRTQAWAKQQATACSAWAGMAAAAGHRRKVCDAAPQDEGILKEVEPPDGWLGQLQALGLGLDLEGPDHKNVAS